jgi:hypothetical protein
VVIVSTSNSTSVSYSFSSTAATPSPPKIAFADLFSWPDLVLTILVVASTAANFMQKTVRCALASLFVPRSQELQIQR